MWLLPDRWRRPRPQSPSRRGGRTLVAVLSRSFCSLPAVLTSPAPASPTAPLSPAPHSTSRLPSLVGAALISAAAPTPSRASRALRALLGTRHRTTFTSTPHIRRSFLSVRAVRTADHDGTPLRGLRRLLRRLAAARAGRRRLRPHRSSPTLDDAYDLVPLTRDEIAGFVDDGLGDVLVPRLFEPAEGDSAVRIDGVDIAAAGDRPVFAIGLRKPPNRSRRSAPTSIAGSTPASSSTRPRSSAGFTATSATREPARRIQLTTSNWTPRPSASASRPPAVATASSTTRSPTTPRRPCSAPRGRRDRLCAPRPQRSRRRDRPDPRGAAHPDDRARFVGAAVGSSPGSLSVDRDRMAEARSRP